MSGAKSDEPSFFVFLVHLSYLDGFPFGLILVRPLGHEFTEKTELYIVCRVFKI